MASYRRQHHHITARPRELVRAIPDFEQAALYRSEVERQYQFAMAAVPARQGDAARPVRSTEGSLARVRRRLGAVLIVCRLACTNAWIVPGSASGGSLGGGSTLPEHRLAPGGARRG
jgi:hypothetical protein